MILSGKVMVRFMTNLKKHLHLKMVIFSEVILAFSFSFLQKTKYEKLKILDYLLEFISRILSICKNVSMFLLSAFISNELTFFYV